MTQRVLHNIENNKKAEVMRSHEGGLLQNVNFGSLTLADTNNLASAVPQQDRRSIFDNKSATIP